MAKSILSLFPSSPWTSLVTLLKNLSWRWLQTLFSYRLTQWTISTGKDSCPINALFTKLKTMMWEQSRISSTLDPTHGKRLSLTWSRLIAYERITFIWTLTIQKGWAPFHILLCRRRELTIICTQSSFKRLLTTSYAIAGALISIWIKACTWH